MEKDFNIPKQQFIQLKKGKKALEQMLKTIYHEYQDQVISPIQFVFDFGQLLLRIELYEKDVRAFSEKHSENFDCESIKFKTTENVEILNYLQEQVSLIQNEGFRNPELSEDKKKNDDSKKPNSSTFFDERFIDPVQRSQSVSNINNFQRNQPFQNFNHENIFQNYQNFNQNMPINSRSQMAFQQFENNKNQNIGNRIPFKASRVQFINKFDGKFRNFDDFYQPFCNNVDKTDLDNATKLQILKSKLDPITRKWLDGYSTDDDYEEAKQTLLRRFNSKFAVKNNVLKEFAELQPPTSDHDLEGYLRITTSARSAYLSLKRAEADNFTVTILTKQIKGKISPIRLAILEERSNNDDIEQIIKYLEYVVDKLQDNSDPFLINNKTFSKSTINPLKRNQILCIFCGNDTHMTKDCKRVLSYTEKNQICKEANVCSGCYQPGHSFRFCQNIEHKTPQNWRSQANHGPTNNEKRGRMPHNNQFSKEKPKSANYLETNNLYDLDDQEDDYYNCESLYSPQNDQENSTQNNENQTTPKEVFSIDSNKKQVKKSKRKNKKKKKISEKSDAEKSNEKETNFSNRKDEQKSVPPILIDAELNEQLVTIQLDPGANVNVMSTKTCENLKLIDFNNEVEIKVPNHNFKLQKACMTKLKIGNIEKNVMFQLINDKIPILLGRDELLAFQIMMMPGENELTPVQMVKLKRSKKKSIEKKLLQGKINKQEDITTTATNDGNHSIDQLNHKVPVVENGQEINDTKLASVKSIQEEEERANNDGHENSRIDHCEIKPPIKAENFIENLEQKKAESPCYESKYAGYDQPGESNMAFVNNNEIQNEFDKILIGNSCNNGSQISDIINESLNWTDSQNHRIGIYKRLIDNRYLEKFKR